MASEERIISVALPLPLQTCFSYRVPEGLPLPERGTRVEVPFSGRRVVGVAVGSGVPPPKGRLVDVAAIVDETALVGPPLIDLALWMADYYLAAPGECLRLLLPPQGIRASRAMVRLSGGVSREAHPVLALLESGPVPVSTLAHRLGRDPGAALARLSRDGAVAVEQDLAASGFRQCRVVQLVNGTFAPRGKAQQEFLSRLQAAGGRAALADLVRDRPALRGTVAGLVRAGAVELTDERSARTPNAMGGVAAPRPSPSAGQSEAVAEICRAVEQRRFASFLLHGVTGSGKTEVYLLAIEQALASGLGAIMLVPEIALTPFLVRAATARFGTSVAVLHSNLSRGERHDEWWRIREGEARVVIGARSAVFAPVEPLGLIVVDEEHEAAYKQEEAPRYHARDVAVMRAKLEGAVVVLGSATPSVESYYNAQQGKYGLLSLPQRVGPQGLPEIDVVDRRAALKAGQDPILTEPLLFGLEQCLSRREQALVLLNRRGYAQCLLCRECGVEAVCPNCSVSLTVHERGRLVECHYCGYERETPSRCASCGGEYLRLTGYGTERVLERLKEALPQARVERLDRDLARRRGAVERVLRDFETGAIDVLVGTQMIAKGHDFPNVTLVGVVDADVGLGLPDFRAAERTFQLLTQVAGRAGRGSVKGRVVLQSHVPEHYALRHACAQEYGAYFEREMEYRHTMGYPPFAGLLNIVMRSADAGRARQEARVVAEALRAAARGRYRVLGPAAAPLARLHGDHREQIVLKGARQAMRVSVREVMVQRYGDVRWPGASVDVDPVSLM